MTDARHGRWCLQNRAWLAAFVAGQSGVFRRYTLAFFGYGGRPYGGAVVVLPTMTAVAALVYRLWFERHDGHYGRYFCPVDTRVDGVLIDRGELSAVWDRMRSEVPYS